MKPISDGSRILYLDAVSGIAGDMTLAALIHAGADLNAVRDAVRLVTGDQVVIESLDHKSGSLVGLRMDVRAKGHDHHHHDHDRNAGSIIESIRAAGLSERTMRRAVAVFSVLAEAEGHVHGVGADKVHFHEVGALDSIADIVGIAAALDDLDIAEIHASALPMGAGFVRTQHGIMPLPAPATLEVLKGYPVHGIDVEGEFVTPTGAAVCAALAVEPGRMPSMLIDSIGYGFGSREWPDHRPNCVRAVVGRPDEAKAIPEYEIAANIDDMTPDDVSRLMDALYEAGALDAWVTPIQMKKGRPAWCVSAIASSRDRGRIQAAFFDESTTIGIRIFALERVKLKYRIDTVATSLGEVRVKRAFRDGREVNMSIESDDLRRIAAERGLSLKRARATVLREIPDRTTT
ncbi:MAG: nickel pincer cofactor biosynthesis protein LarC [Deltaproteobacteria bacterium]|nr:nickel pincer cofactor biosynthesis protein LarC [Deltaproteobacteria bacterium]